MVIQHNDGVRKAPESSRRPRTRKAGTAAAGQKGRSADSKQTSDSRGSHEDVSRRLIDKIGVAIAQAESQGREEIVERLQLIHRSVQEIDASRPGRRVTDTMAD